MTPKTVEGVLNPDGRLTLPPEELPEYPVRVLITILEDPEVDTLSELGDYVGQLTDYEDQLARGEIRWQ